MDKRDKKLLLANISIIILEIIGLTITLPVTKKIELRFYTEDSNILMLVTSIITSYYILKKKLTSRWLDVLYHMSVLGLTVTFLVVVFILGPMYKFNYAWLLFGGSMLYLHTICPIVAFITYILFYKNHINKKDLPYTMSFTVIYAVIIIICNLFHIIDGPYPFLMIYKQPIYISLLWIVLILGGAYLLSVGIYTIKRRISTK